MPSNLSANCAKSNLSDSTSSSLAVTVSRSAFCSLRMAELIFPLDLLMKISNIFPRNLSLARNAHSTALRPLFPDALTASGNCINKKATISSDTLWRKARWSGNICWSSVQRRPSGNNLTRRPITAGGAPHTMARCSGNCDHLTLDASSGSNRVTHVLAWSAGEIGSVKNEPLQYPVSKNLMIGSNSVGSTAASIALYKVEQSRS